MRRRQLLHTFANRFWLQRTVLHGAARNKRATLTTVVYPQARLGRGNQQMVIRQRRQNGGKDATRWKGADGNADDDIGSCVFGMIGRNADIKLTGCAVDGGGYKDVWRHGGDHFDRIQMTRPQGRHGTFNRGVPDLMVQTGGSDVCVASVRHKSDTKDVGHVTRGKDGALAKGGHVPQTQGAIIGCRDESLVVIGKG